MAEKMIGAGLKDITKPAGRSFGKEKLVVNKLSVPGVGHFGIALKDVTFTVRAGEIFGIAGVAGNGQNALLLAMSGEIPVEDAEAIRSMVNGWAAQCQATPPSWYRLRSGRAQRPCGSAGLHAFRQFGADRARPAAHGAVD
jgi:ABC-type uncharacterized transport system ATPase subunit